MANFLDDLSIYNAKAASVIKNLSLSGDSEKATFLSSLKTTANDITLSESVRLNALTALINAGRLLEIALPPYFPAVTTYSDNQSYTGIHNDLEGLNDGTQYLHITSAEKSSFQNKASLSDITFSNLIGNPSDNANLTAALNGKQPLLSGTGLVRIVGSIISYDSTPYISTIAGIAAEGDLTGTYPNPTITNTIVVGKTLAGFSSTTGTITSSDTIVSAMSKLNGNLATVASSAGTVTSVSFAMPSSLFDFAAGPFSTSAALSATLIEQNANTMFAAPDGTNGVPTFRSLLATDLPASGVGAGTYGSSTTIPQVTVDTYGRITAISATSFSSGGTVTSVGLTGPGEFGYGSAVTTTGNLSFTWQNQNPALVLAGPVTGAAAAPTFRALAATDIPNIAISQVTNLTETLSGYIGNTLTLNSIFIGNGSNILADSVVSGDLSAYYDEAQDFTNLAVFTIADKAVTYAKFQDIPTKVLLGRAAATTGVMQQVTLNATDFVFSDAGEISLFAPVAPILQDKGDLLTSQGSSNQVRLPIGTNATILMADSAIATGNKWVALGGAITFGVNGVVSIVDGQVALSALADIANNTILGNISGSTNEVVALTGANVNTMLPIFSTSLNGVVPTPGSALGATYYLDATGNWSIPAGGGGGGGSPSGTVGSVQYNNSGSFGGTSGMWSNGTDVYVTDSKFGITDNAFSPTNGVTFSVASVVGARTWSFPDLDATFVGEALTQGLTNKTLGSGTKVLIGSDATGDVYYNGGSGTLTRLAIGGAGQVLTVAGGIPSWATPTSGSVTAISVVTANGFAGTSSGGATPALTLTTSVAGLLKGNGTAISAATSGTDYAPATSGSSILYGNGAGGFSAVTIGTNLSFTGGTLNASSTMVYPGAGIANSTGTAWGTSYTTTGTGTVLALASSPTLVTPVLGVATATSINKVAITAPATSATLTIADGKTLTMSNTLTFTGTDTSSVAFGGGGTVAYVGVVNSWGSGIKQTFNPSGTNAGINVGSVTSAPSSPVVGDLIYNTSASQLQGYVGTTWISLGGGGSGTINTGVQYAVPYYTTAGTTLDDITPPTTNGTYVLTSVVSASAAVLPTWVAPSIPFNALIAAAATNTINNVSYAQEWQWNSLAGATGLKLSSTSTAAASNTQTLFAVALSGANATTTQTTTAASIANTHTGTSSTNIGLSLAASGGTTINYALDVTAGISRFAAGTASVPQLVLTPSSAIVPSGTVDGSIWYDTTANNSTIQLRKLYTTGTSVLTKVITASYNPDFATGTASGVVVADLNGTLTKSADLTALGIFAQSSTVTVASTIAATTLLGTLTGSATLPVNFFAVGKTIIVYVTGTYNGTASSPTCTLNLTIGGIAMGSIVLTHNNALTTVFYDAQFIVTCRTTGASGTLQYSAIGKLNSGTATSSSVFFQNSATSGSVDTTGTLLVGLTATWSASSGSNSLTASIVTATYLN